MLRRGRKPEPLPTVDLKGVEPFVQMGTLDEILTGRSFDDVLQDTSAEIIAERDDGERLVARLTRTLQEALARADTMRLKDAAARWSATEEFGGVADPVELGECLVELAGLARTAELQRQRMYCWLCV
jgi:hypothetical protein